MDEPNEYPRVSALCETFPALRGNPGVRPFKPELFASHHGVASSGERYAIRFVLSVFNNRALRDGLYKSGRSKIPPFDLIDALATWDHGNRDACLAWAANPWWP